MVAVVLARLKCPRCATVVEAALASAAVCPRCGYRGPTASPAVPAQAAPVDSAEPAGAPRHGRPGWVVFAAIATLIGGGIAIAVGLLAVVFALILTGFGGGQVGRLIAAGALVAVLLGVFAVIVAVFLFLGRPWARAAAFVLASLALAISVARLAFFALQARANAFGSDLATLLGSVPAVAVEALVFYALMRPESKAFFHRSGAPAPTTH